jgi:hypothetical protein
MVFIGKKQPLYVGILRVLCEGHYKHKDSEEYEDCENEKHILKNTLLKE